MLEKQTLLYVNWRFSFALREVEVAVFQNPISKNKNYKK